ncbi:lysyl oxidase family protein [Nocardioides sp. MAHUQ-72]|uniref:lysyl oxidase family protein n=1 Tax=unclassified Nocardioides TaxID=2615069 RepID=UPI00361CAC7F
MLRHSWRPGARALGVAAALALAVPAVTTSADATPSAAAEGSPLTLWAPGKVVAYSYEGQVWTDFGLRLIAPTDPFEIYSTRASYDAPIVSEWHSPTGTQVLPEELAMADFTGLTGFAGITVRRVDTGKRVAKMDLSGCLNGYDAQRVRPDAPARSTYPTSCPWNPYTLGSVMGIEGGYASPLLPEWENSYELKPGKYDVTARIAPAYADFFGIDATDAKATTRLVVKKETEGDYRPAAPRPGAIAKPAAHAPQGESAGDISGPTPDLRSLPAFGIGLNRKGNALRFAATVWNAGTSPMVVDGYRGEDGDHMDAYQYFFDTDGNQTGYQQVGEMHWHAQNHQHWHFEDFARYRLLNADKTRAVISGKRSFCLANTDAVDYTVEGADWMPENTDLSTACGGHDALSVREVLASGSGDTYMQYRYGQAFRLDKVEDGIYYIAVEANPLHSGARNLIESDYDNNDSLRKIRLSTDKQGHRKVKVFQVGNILEPDFYGK